MHKLNLKPLRDRPTKKRIAVDIPILVYAGMIQATRRRYCRLTKWIRSAIVEKLQKEKEFLK